MYGIPFSGTAVRRSRQWVANSIWSLILMSGTWCSFGFHLYCIKTFWRGKFKPQIPIETLILLIPLTLSGAMSFTVMVWYFYNPRNNFSHSKTRLVPHFEYMPEGHQKDVGPESNDWKYVNIFLFFGIVSVVLVLYVAFDLNVFFDFAGLHDFTAHIHDLWLCLYYFSVSMIYWGFISVVVACCIFYICCRDIVRHIEHTEKIILKKANNYLLARHYHDSLLTYTDSIMSATKLWFGIHSLFFMFIIISVAFEWITAFSGKKHYENIAIIILSQSVGSFLIAFKFAFPILAASRVTARFEKMYRVINRNWKPDKMPEVNVFMNYCCRCEAGFTLFGVKMTAQLALISLLSCFVGFFKLYRKVS
ncbi:uncharacterized protein LOC110246260 isoform X2 [Exaiptasia diaphana]|nr:uncharacterized protein LOC110246260 isoform X2 [Exaiptasia diaphana]XP_020908240.1 uncharacterized protein LOC110246260 isoform X2 [Exaiptasia diaphana]